MKLKTLFIMSVAALCSMACSKNDDVPTVADIAGTYEGYTLASCAYFENRYTDGESLTMTAAGDGTLSLAFESASWGRFEVASVDIARDGNIYTLTGNGSVAMGMGGATSSYDFTLTGSVNASKDDYSFKFEVPAVMGGLTITLLPGSAPSESEK